MTTTEQVKFVQFHQPGLESGEYHINITQTIAPIDGKLDQQTYTRDLTFAVLGERFGPIPPDDIYSVFPPPESLGEHSNVLPHITFKRSTLPWERYPIPGTDDNRSWLALLLFRETDFAPPEDESKDYTLIEKDRPKTRSITLQNLQDSVADASEPQFPEFDIELGQTPAQLVTVLDVKKRYVVDILPVYQDLDYTAHVRQAVAPSRDFSGDEYATIICNRLPEPNGVSTVHLVSIEGRYDDNGNFDFMGAGDNDLIRFVSLASWSFACIDPEQTFTELVKKLNHTPCSLRLPKSDDPQAETFLKKGYMPLPHDMRQGSQTVSWYRSPLIPGLNEEPSGIASDEPAPPNPDLLVEFPVKAADALLRYDSDLGLFDTSYSAAWQLGRMLTLQNKSIAIELYNWKRANAHRLHQLEDGLMNLPLRSRANNPETLPAPILPQKVIDWFAGLELLKGIPFNYIVPDERLLPVESLRFFWVDSLWVDSLQDGAFSIGRVTEKSVADDRTIRSNHRSLTRSTDQKITGVIMRSQVVTGWPHLIIDGYGDLGTIDGSGDIVDPTSPLKLLRMEKLAKDIVLCLFKGDVKTVDVHLQPEAMHFGLDAGGEDGIWTKNLRNAAGQIIAASEIDVPLKTKGVVDLNAFTSDMQTSLNSLDSDNAAQYQTFTSGQFGLQMIEGVQKVRFTIDGGDA